MLWTKILRLKGVWLMNKVFKSRKGWTLVELIVVVVIIVVITAAVTIGFIIMAQDLPDPGMMG